MQHTPSQSTLNAIQVAQHTLAHLLKMHSFTQYTLVINVCDTDKNNFADSSIMRKQISRFHPVDGVSLKQHLLLQKGCLLENKCYACMHAHPSLSLHL